MLTVAGNTRGTIDHPHHGVVDAHGRVVGTSVVLVIDEDDSSRDLAAQHLSRVGFSVLTCPGPFTSDPGCDAGPDGECPLAATADVIVLNTRSAADSIMEGVPGWQLLQHYIATGKPIVAIGDGDRSIRGAEAGTIALVDPTPAEIARAVRSLVPASDVLDRVLRLAGAIRPRWDR